MALLGQQEEGQQEHLEKEQEAHFHHGRHAVQRQPNAPNELDLPGLLYEVADDEGIAADLDIAKLLKSTGDTPAPVVAALDAMRKSLNEGGGMPDGKESATGAEEATWPLLIDTMEYLTASLAALAGALAFRPRRAGCSTPADTR